MSRTRAPFAGRMDAVGFVLDPAVIGEAETRRRVLMLWTEGAGLYDFENRLVLTLPEPVSIRAEQAPGLPIESTQRRLRITHAGTTVDLDPDQLRPSDLTRWVDLTPLVPVALEALGSQPSPVLDLVAAPKTVPPADLRTATGIGTPDGRLGRGLRRMRQDQDNHRARDVGAPNRSKGDRISRLTMRTPAARIIGRRHAKYVEKLAASFENKDWDSALRSAISLGGTAGPLNLRLPRPRARVGGPGRPQPAGGSVPYGPSVNEHLRQVYLRAADQLQQAGRFLEAAFVHADLLDQPVAAVELLERHGQARVAAELAEDWALDPALVVRLWWRAGDRDRAINIASTRAAFAGAIDRLDSLDPVAALDLRRAWMLDRRAAGDHVGAVEAAWPTVVLRDEALPDIAAGVAGGGATAGLLLAHLLSHGPDRAQAHALATALLGQDPQARAAKSGFIRSFAKHPAADSTQDRELSTSVLLSVLRDDHDLSHHEVGEVRRALKHRADPLLVADLPHQSPRRPDASPTTGLEIDARLGGQLEILDVVAIGPRTVLLALGELGARLVTHDGRTRGRWDIPTHRLVVADHGNRVLLVGDRGVGTALHELDLPLGRPKALPQLPGSSYLLDTYDGSRLVTVSDGGIRWLSAVTDRWQVSWQELADRPVSIWQVVRTPDKLTALFADPVPNVWQWDLPDIMLRQRSTHLEDGSLTVLADGLIGRVREGSFGNHNLTWTTAWNAVVATMTLGGGTTEAVQAFGTGFVLTEPREDHNVLHIHLEAGQTPIARVKVPVDLPSVVRRFRNLLTIAHRGGRTIVIDTATAQVVCDFRTRI